MWKVFILATVLSSGVVAGELESRGARFKLLTRGYEFFNVKVGEYFATDRPKQRVLIREMPEELEGLPAVRGPVSGHKSETIITIESTKPFRVYVPLSWISLPESKSQGRFPDDWKLYSQGNFSATGHEKRDVYYRDFRAGRNEIRIGAFFFILALNPLDSLSEREKFTPELTLPRRTGIYAPDEEVVVVLGGEYAGRGSASVSYSIELRRDFGEPKLIKKGNFSCKPAQSFSRELSLGILPEGFHLLEARLRFRKERYLCTLPIGIAPPPKHAKMPEHFIPFGVYRKYSHSRRPVYSNTYFAYTCYLLRKYGFNALKDGVVTKEQLDIARSYGIRVCPSVRSNYLEQVLQHPAVIGLIYGDEPTKERIQSYREKYDELAKVTRKPVLTCMVGESTLTGAKNDPIPLWEVLKPKVRLVRFYPFRKGCYDLLHPPAYKGWIPFASALRVFQAYEKTPYWYVGQSFGFEKTERRPEPYWSNPTPSQVRGMIHLALAYGARGIFLYTFESERNTLAFVDGESLRPTDEKISVIKEISARLSKYTPILLHPELKFGGFETRVTDWRVEAVPYRIGGKAYTYLVNKDTDHRVRTELLFPPRIEVTDVLDLFSGSSLQEVSASRFVAELAPGEGKLIELLWSKK